MPFIFIHFPGPSNSITNQNLYKAVVDGFCSLKELDLREEMLHFIFTEEKHVFETKVPRAIVIKVDALDNPRAMDMKQNITDTIVAKASNVLIDEKLRCVVHYLEPKRTAYAKSN